MEIRKAAPEDFDEILILKLESKEEERKFNQFLKPVPDVKKHYEKYLSNDLNSKWRVVFVAEENNAITYESYNTLFFILAPTKTRTFKNEKMALEIANKIKETLTNHNKILKHKINFGISLNYGTIVGKQDKDSFKFMGLGTLMNTTKKISSIAEEEILLSDKMNDVFGSHLKTTKQEKRGLDVYSIKEIRNVEEHKKFIKNFLDRIEGKK